MRDADRLLNKQVNIPQQATTRTGQNEWRPNLGINILEERAILREYIVYWRLGPDSRWKLAGAIAARLGALVSFTFIEPDSTRRTIARWLRTWFAWHPQTFIVTLWTSAVGVLIGTPTAESYDLLQPAVCLTYGLFSAAFVWSIGAWLTSKSLHHSNPAKWPKKKKPSERDWSIHLRKKWGVSCLLLIPFAASMWITHRVDYRIQLLRLNGVLIPAGDPTPPNPCGAPPDGDVVFLYSDNASLAHTFPHVILRSLTLGPVITLDRLSDGSVVVIMDILDPNGKIVVHLGKDGFKVNPNLIMTRQRPDQSTLIVNGEYPGDSFHIRYLNKQAIRLDGTFHYPGISTAIPLRITGLSHVCTKGGDNQGLFGSDLSIR